MKCLLKTIRVALFPRCPSPGRRWQCSGPSCGHLAVSLFKGGVSCSQGGRPAKCCNVQMLISRQTLRQCVELLDKFLISLFVEWLLKSPMVVSFSSLPLGVEGQALHHPSPAASSTTAAGTSEEEGLHTALFLTFSRWPSTSSPGTSEEEGLAPLPSSSQRRWVPRRRRDRPCSSHRRCVLHAYGRGQR